MIKIKLIDDGKLVYARLVLDYTCSELEKKIVRMYFSKVFLEAIIPLSVLQWGLIPLSIYNGGHHLLSTAWFKLS